MSDFAAKKTEEEEVPKVEKTEEGEDDGDDEGPAPEEESTATFTPVIKLEVVETKSHEEEEDIIYKQRAKLFTFGETLLNKGTGTKSWNEKGLGDVKLLKHKESSRIRVLMRQEKTMKVIANHFLDPRITLSPNVGTDKSWVWKAFDFSDNELVEQTFAIRFGTSDIAKEFKEAFIAGQVEMTALMGGEDAKIPAEGADEVTAAIGSLAVTSNEEAHAHGHDSAAHEHDHSKCHDAAHDHDAVAHEHGHEAATHAHAHDATHAHAHDSAHAHDDAKK